MMGRGLQLSVGFLVFASAVNAEKVSYDGYKVLRVSSMGREDAQFLDSFRDQLDFWSSLKVVGNTDVMVSPGQMDAFVAALDSRGISHHVAIEDVQALFDDEGDNRNATRRSEQTNFDFDSYKTLDEIYAWFDFLEATYDYVETEVIGESFEGRELRLLKICTDGCNDQKPAMFIDAGIHAREWIGPAVLTYHIYALTEGRAATDDDLVDLLDWYFLPVVNPDGYTFSITDDRLWRKTRSVNEGNLCLGVDANRNYDYEWATVGATNASCRGNYQGQEAFSEVEIQAIRDFMMARPAGQIKFFNDMHSYGQLVLLPWGYTTEPIPDYDDLFEKAERARQALMSVHGKHYEMGCIPCILYEASGGSIDWVYGAAGVKYAIGMELRDHGRYGFELPADQIVANAEEVLAFHASFARDIIQEFA